MQEKRLIKNAKNYFLDTGRVSYLTVFRTPERVFNGPLARQLFKNYVIQEIVKFYDHHGRRPPLYYLSTSLITWKSIS